MLFRSLHSQRQYVYSVEVKKSLQSEMQKDEYREEVEPDAHLPGRVSQKAWAEGGRSEPWTNHLREHTRRVEYCRTQSCSCGARPDTGLSARQHTGWIGRRSACILLFLRLGRVLQTDDTHRPWCWSSSYRIVVVRCARPRFVEHSNHGGRMDGRTRSRGRRPLRKPRRITFRRGVLLG